MFGSQKKILAILTAVSVAGAFAKPTVAEPRLLGINDLSESEQKILWERVDHVAAYVTILKACASDPDFEKRFVDAVQPCVEGDTVRRVVGFYRERAAALDKRLKRNFCASKKYVEDNGTQKLKSILENLVTVGHNLCLAYLRTGVIGR
jgi:hypothetical protein